VPVRDDGAKNVKILELLHFLAAPASVAILDHARDARIIGINLLKFRAIVKDDENLDLASGCEDSGSRLLVLDQRNKRDLTIGSLEDRAENLPAHEISQTEPDAKAHGCKHDRS